jgi:hypothetical protein
VVAEAPTASAARALADEVFGLAGDAL